MTGGISFDRQGQSNAEGMDTAKFFDHKKLFVRLATHMKIRVRAFTVGARVARAIDERRRVCVCVCVCARVCVFITSNINTKK